jgi:hypothetical protein
LFWQASLFGLFPAENKKKRKKGQKSKLSTIIFSIFDKRLQATTLVA